MHLNFEPVNIFPGASQVIEYLDRRLPRSATMARAHARRRARRGHGEGQLGAKERLDADNYEQYIRSYAAAFEPLFAARESQYRPQDGGARLLGGVQSVLEEKLAGLTLHGRVPHPAYFRLDDLPGRMLRVDFPTRTIEQVDGLSDGDFYSVTAPSWEVARVLDGKITWDDFSLHVPHGAGTGSPTSTTPSSRAF